MSNELKDLDVAHLAEALRADVAAWNAYRAANPEWAPCLVGANLCRANLYGANLVGASLYGANLVGANLCRTDLDRANLCGANLYGANFGNIDPSPWSDLRDLGTTSSGLRIAFKRLPEHRTTGGTNGRPTIKWSAGRWVEAPDWDPVPECGNGLHLSASPGETRAYSNHPICIPVAFDPADAVVLGDKIKVRRCKVLA